MWLRSSTPYDLFSEDGLQRFVSMLGWWGPLVYILLIALAVVISQIPGVPMTLAAGALWGPLLGTTYSVIGAFLGATIAYFLGRSLGRSAMKALTGKVVTFSKERGEPFLGFLVFITRALPLFPFDIVSYAAGLSGLAFKIYAPATLLGVIPSTFLLSYLGSAFTFNVPVALSLSAVAIIILMLAPLLMRRYDWLHLGDVVRVE